MAKKYDFVIVSQQSWDVQIGSNIKDIALEISKKNRVLFINRPLDMSTLITKRKSQKSYVSKRLKARKKKLSFESINDNLTILTPKPILLSLNSLPDGKLFDFLNEHNNSLIANQIKKATDKLNFKDYILLNDGELFNGYYLPKLLKPSTSLYYFRDNFLAVPFWQKHGSRLEPSLFKNYDAVVCNSIYLKEIAAAQNPNAFYVGQGCNYSIYEQPAAANRRTKKPIVGYVGALNSLRLDLSLLETLARKNKQWDWVFVGPEDLQFEKSKLHQFENVAFEGPKRPEELASYISNFDVAINPQLTNEVTIGNYPRKIDEYLYMGKPTVATETKAMLMFNEHCYLACDAVGYEMSIKKALHENSIEKERARKAFAETHSWENSVNSIYTSIEQL
jgi:teichuronic acid biosynthesis glycosyltransferase TuaH